MSKADRIRIERDSERESENNIIPNEIRTRRRRDRFFFFFFPRSSLVTFQKCIKTKTERMEKDTVPDARLKVAA